MWQGAQILCPKLKSATGMEVVDWNPMTSIPNIKKNLPTFGTAHGTIPWILATILRSAAGMKMIIWDLTRSILNAKIITGLGMVNTNLEGILTTIEKIVTGKEAIVWSFTLITQTAKQMTLRNWGMVDMTPPCTIRTVIKNLLVGMEAILKSLTTGILIANHDILLVLRMTYADAGRRRKNAGIDYPKITSCFVRQHYTYRKKEVSWTNRIDYSTIYNSSILLMTISNFNW
jgi:hypothetical protein